MSTDRELLEAAANAAGIEFVGWDEDPFDPEFSHNGTPCLKLASGWWWNSLADDGDAFRLAVKLELNVMVGVVKTPDGFTAIEYSKDGSRDDYACTRRAIVRAAASMNKETNHD
jgi:hypothetical protein